VLCSHNKVLEIFFVEFFISKS